MKLVNIFLDFKTKHIMKGAIPEIKKKWGNHTCEIIPSEKPNITEQKFDQSKGGTKG